MAAFKAEVFEALHAGPVAGLAAGPPGSGQALEDAFAELRAHRESLSRPCGFRGREDTVDLSALAQHVTTASPRLASERLVRAVDEVSRALRLHQHDCCALVEQALDLTANFAEVPHKCAAIFHRECHFQALVLHDMAQGLAQTPPARHSVAFFAMLGGPAFVRALLESLSLFLRDATGERSGDQMFLSHACAMIRLYAQTLLAYYYAFQASADEVEAVLSLLLHVVSAQHAPPSQGPSVSDLDLILREDHADISVKLCLALVCMCLPQVRGDEGKIDPGKLQQGATPTGIRVQDLLASRDAGGPLGPRGGRTPLGTKMQAGDYWNQESQLGQFLAFAISGVLLEDEQALRNGYVHWHTFHFLLHDILLSGTIISDTCTSHLVLKSVSALLARALLPVGRGWMAIKKLEARAVGYGMLAPDVLQISILQVLGRLCRVCPGACDSFWPVASYCTDNFHMSAPQGQFAAPARHESTALYYEILELLASLCGRGSVHCARHVCQKLMSHSNQWFNWNFLTGMLVQHLQDAQAAPSTALALPSTLSARAAPVAAALCRLTAAVCSGRLWVCSPPPTLSIQVLPAAADPSAPGPGDELARLLAELLAAHPEPAVKSACLGALAGLNVSQRAARQAFGSLISALPTMLNGVTDARGGQEGALAIELLSCALRLAQAIPIGKGRYALDLQPLTHIVVHHICMKVLASPSQFSSAARYWRLAALALRWLRLALRGPLPPVACTQVCAALLEPYADSGDGVAQVAARTAAGNATAYAFRCMLTLDSPLFARVMHLALLCGHGVEHLAEGRGCGAAGPSMRQAAMVGMDVLRILFQRDTLFCALYGQQATERGAGMGPAGLDAGDLQLTHRPLLGEFGFEYPPSEGGFAAAPASLNPFAARRPGQGGAAAPASALAGGGAGRRANPSYFALLLEFASPASGPEIGRLATYLLMQCALREPGAVLRTLQLEAWRCQRLSVDLHDLILRPGSEGSHAAAGAYGTWGSQAEAQFLFEVADMDVAPDVATHLGAVSFQTGLPVCLALDAAQQLADDAIVQSSDLVAWAQGVGGGRPGTAAAGLQSGASTDGRRFRMAYLQGLDVRAEWLGAVAAAGSAVVSPPALAVSPCRLLILRTLLLLLNGITPNEAEAEAPKLAQMLLGLDPEPAAGADVDVDAARAAQPMPLDALMALLENPPPVPAQPEGSGGPWPSDGRALRSRGVDQGTSQALEQHAIYEAALGVLLGLFNAPALRDVALRYACHAWPSRYQAVRDLLGLQWEAVAGPLRCLLLSEASLTLQAVSWEMRLVPPAGAPPPRQVLPPSFAAQQRLDMKRAVADHLQEVAQSLFSPCDAGSPAAHSAAPFLVKSALRLAEAGEPEAGSPGSGPPQLAQDVLRLSRTSLLAVSDAGDAALRLDLHDPHLLLRTLQAGRKWLSATGSPVDPAALSAEEAEMLGAVGASNEAACAAFFSKAASSSLHLFTAAALHHLAAGGARPGALARHPRGQVARAHLEALLPALAAAPGGAPERAELLARLACGFVVAAQQTESPPPRAFVGSLFCALRDMALDPASSPEVRKCTHQALFLVLHRMLPAPQAGPDARLGDHELAALRGLAGALAREAASSHDGAQDGLQARPAALPALVALLLRVPQHQLPGLFPDGAPAAQLASLLAVGPGAAPAGQDARSAVPQRLQAACAAALLCRAPPLAAAFFEAGGLAAVLRPGFLEAAQARLALPGLHVLEVPHPTLLVALLQLLVAVVRALPAHRLVFHEVVSWLERHQRLLTDLPHWLARLPLATSVEPAGAEPAGFATGACGTAAGGGSALLVFCAGGAAEPDDSGAGAVAAAAAGGSLGAVGSEPAREADESGSAVAGCFQCTRLLAELWGALWAAAPPAGVGKQPLAKAQPPPAAAGGPPAAEAPRAALERLAPAVEAALMPLLAQLCSVLPRPPGDEPMPDAGRGPAAPPLAAGAPQPPAAAGAPAGPADLCPPPSLRLATCVHVLQAWRQDGVPQRLRALGGAGPALAAGAPAGPPAPRSAWGPQVAGPGGGWQWASPSGAGDAPGTSALAQLTGQVRARAGVLCLVLVHSCSELLGVRFAGAAAPAPGGDLRGGGAGLQFAGSAERFQVLLLLTELSLHLLHAHLGALCAAASAGGAAVAAAAASVTAPPPGVPRRALVVRCLRALRQLSCLAGGAVALEADEDPTIAPGRSSRKVLDLSFAASVAEGVEELMEGLQVL